jgi:hypothetical protein
MQRADGQCTTSNHAQARKSTILTWYQQKYNRASPTHVPTLSLVALRWTRRGNKGTIMLTAHIYSTAGAGFAILKQEPPAFDGGPNHLLH